MTCLSHARPGRLLSRLASSRRPLVASLVATFLAATAIAAASAAGAQAAVSATPTKPIIAAVAGFNRVWSGYQWTLVPSTAVAVRYSPTPTSPIIAARAGYSRVWNGYQWSLVPTATVTLATAGSVGLVRGVNDHPIWQRTPAQETSLGYLAQAGVQSVRLDVPWDIVEPDQKGVYNSLRLSLLDNFVNGLHARGIDPLLIVLQAPRWANGSTDPKVPPIKDSDYADFLGFLMQRYAGKVHAYEIWNEPNGGWAWTNPSPSRYTALLKAAYVRAKSIDPSATILGGSLSGTDGGPQAFLRGMYAAGAKGYFDVLSQHGYGDVNRGAYPGATYPIAPSTVLGGFTRNILPIMKQYGDGAKPVWWTETGMTTATGTNSEQAAASYLLKTYAAARAIPQIRRLYWYEWMGSGANPSSTEDNYGIIAAPPNSSWRFKPAYNALASLKG